MDDIVFFQPLNVNQLSSIVHLQLQSLEERLKDQDITIKLTDFGLAMHVTGPIKTVCGTPT